MKTSERLEILKARCIECAYRISIDDGKSTEEQLREAKLKDLIRWEQAMLEFLAEFEGEPSKALSEAVGKIIVVGLSQNLLKSPKPL